MSQKTNDRDRLGEFLREHRPEVPPPARNLEERIMAAVTGDRELVRQAVTPASQDPRASRKARYLWLMPLALAAGFPLAWVSYKTLMPSQPTATELAHLEAFMESTWDSTLGDRALDPSTEWVFPDEAIAE